MAIKILSVLPKLLNLIKTSELKGIYFSKFKFALISRPNNNGNVAIEIVSKIELIKLKKMLIRKALKFFLFKNFLYILKKVYQKIFRRFNNDLNYVQRIYNDLNKLNQILYINSTNNTNKIAILLKKEKLILKIYENFFYQILLNVSKNKKINEGEFRNFLKEKIHTFSDQCLLNLYYFFCYHSCYKLAFFVYREFFLRNKNDLSSYDKFISNFIFSENKEIFKKYFEKKNQINLYNLFFLKNKITTKDSVKNKIFSNKKICVLGPMDTNTSNFKQESDCSIIRFNLNEKNYINYKSKNIKIKDEISFYNSTNIFEISKEKANAPYRSIKYIFCRFNNFAKNKKNEIEKKYKIKLIFIENTKSIFLNNLTGLNTALLEILQFSPKKIKVFNCDFMLSSSRILNYYPETQKNEYDEKILKWGKGSVGHNLLLQFSIAKKIYNLKKIDGDELFINTINLSFEEYMMKMYEKHYLNK